MSDCSFLEPELSSPNTVHAHVCCGGIHVIKESLSVSIFTFEPTHQFMISAYLKASWIIALIVATYVRH
jgi:hypothetical protein